MTTWTRVADPLADLSLLPAWFAHRMLGVAGAGESFGLLLTTGDVLRVASLAAAHLSSEGTVLLDVVLDHAGVPPGIDLAWQSKHYLGTPLPGRAAEATVNLAQVVAMVAFTANAAADRPGATAAAAEAEANISATVDELAQATEPTDAPLPR